MLYYERNGQETGETLVMIHGFLGGHSIFDKVTNELRQSYDVLVIDLPGHGQSELNITNHTIDDYVKAIVEVLKHEKITNATWLGHSMGGYIVLAALEKDVAPIDKMILAYSSASPDSEEAKNKRDTQAKKIEQHGVQTFVDDSIVGFFAEDAQLADIDMARHIAYDATKEGLQAALQAMKTRRDQRMLLDETTVPTLIIEGDADKVVAPIETDNIAVQKIATHSGHLGMLEDPQAFVYAIKHFLG